MKKLLFSLCLLLLLAAFAASFAFAWSYREYIGAGPLEKPALFIVEKGQGVTAIAGNLERAGIIDRPLIFKIAARLTKTDTQIHAGEYRFLSGQSIKDILEAMAAGDIYLRQFTVPEGLTSWQIVQLLNGIEELSGEIKVIPPEGSLLPETYSYVRGDTRQEKIAQMQKAMEDTLDQLWQAKPENGLLLSEAEAVILASIVEKETGVASERRRVAGVFINRLSKGMKLQTDPTVIYALTEGKIQDEGQGPLGRRLLIKDLQFDSPYNTYKYPGLPPGPIANPGRASLEAVFNPEDHDYYYFVADGTGGHVFAETLAEHNRNVAAWRKIRKSAGE